MEASADVSKVVSAIMQNPDLIERIKELVSSAPPPQDEREEPISSEPPEDGTAAPASLDISKIHTSHDSSRTDKRRHELLCALKPYVSKERAKVIDSMLSFATVFNIIKEK